MTKNKISRRDFLKVAGLTAGITAAAGCGLGTLALQQPEIILIEEHFEGAKDMKKVLVAYATKAGSTGEVAKAIGEELSAKGMSVDVLQVSQVTGLSDYQAVILGSAIRMGRWLPEAVQFVEKHKPDLSRIPTVYFLMSGFLREDTPEMRATVQAYLDPVRKIIEPAAIGLFAGKMDYGKITFLDRTVAKMVKSPEGDFRDWQAIRSWAGELAPVL